MDRRRYAFLVLMGGYWFIKNSAGRACRRQQVADGERPQSSQYGRHERGHTVAGSTRIRLKEVLNEGREKMYSQGGIFSITSRILVVDLLSSKGALIESPITSLPFQGC